MDTAMPGPLLTAFEHQSYVSELNRLEEVRDRDLPELLRTARTFVTDDAAEGIIQIQDDYAAVGARIARLKELVGTARIVDGDGAPDVVTLGREPRSSTSGRARSSPIGSPASRAGPAPAPSPPAPPWVPR